MNVLFVDDNTDTASLFTDLAMAWGHTARAANSALEALSLSRTCAWDLVFLDVLIGNDDGVSLGRKIRGLAEPRRVRLVAISGDAESRGRCEASNFDGFLLKPVSISDLQGWFDSRQ
ncbi:protein of unknown function (plasmid) [Pararobbsia alpina]|uniref:response regulator n=1 Tax=Pararobbsia alpina TaxID=621374 RepID=UPI0039A5D2D1